MRLRVCTSSETSESVCMDVLAVCRALTLYQTLVPTGGVSAVNTLGGIKVLILAFGRRFPQSIDHWTIVTYVIHALTTKYWTVHYTNERCLCGSRQ